MPWTSAANRQITIGRVAGCVACNAWVDLFANREWRDLCKKLTRFLRSRVLIAELMRVLRRKGPTKHFLKTSEFNTHEATRFLKSNGLDFVMAVFFKARY